MKLTKFLVTMLMGLLAVEAFAQTFTLRGTVEDQLGGVAGAVVMEVGNQTNGVITNGMGEFTITVPVGSQIKVSFVGYKEEIVSVTGKNDITITLTEDTEFLDEVLVVGYGTQKKQFVVGSVSQVTSKDLLKAPTTNASQMLTGRLAGMTTVQTSGIPGEDEATLYVRGQSTFNSSSPLVLVDGVEGNMNTLNPNDIESVSILKDAATAAIYGVRAANGVVLVTTKKGHEGTSHISYDGSVSFDTNTCNPDLLNAEEFIYWHNYARELDGMQPYWTEERIASLKERGLYKETNWWSEIYNNYGFTQQHNISATGGNDKVNYYTSIGYMDQQGIMKETSMNRTNVRANVDARLAKGLRYNINLAATSTNRHWPGVSMRSSDGQWQGEYSPLRQALFACPIITGEYNGLTCGYYDGIYTYDPIGYLSSGYQNEKGWKVELRSSLEYDFSESAISFLEGLKAQVYVAYNFDYTLDHNYIETFQYYSYNPNSDEATQLTSDGITQNNFNKSHSIGYNMTIRPQLTYERDFGKNHVSGLFLFERYNYNYDYLTGYKADYVDGSPIDINLGLTDASTPVTGAHGASGSASFAGRLGYAFDKKYIAEATLRADASYKFAPANRWGFFPSVALGWVMSEESFMKGQRWLNYLKLRGSAGVLGSDDTDAYLYMQTYYSTAPSTSYVLNGSAMSTFYTGGYVYDNLTWSRTNTYNIGFESRMLNNRLSVEFDWFYKYTSRILEYSYYGTYSPSLGGNYPSWQNSGEVDNRGFDMTVSWGDSLGGDWSYYVTGILGWSRNKVLQMLLSDDHPSYRAVLGQPMGQQYGFHSLGLFQTQEQLDNYPVAPSGEVRLGSIRYEDYNGDGKITSTDDYVWIGRSTVPEMTFSMNLELRWRTWSLSALFQGATLCNYSLLGTYANGNLDSTIYTRCFYAGANTMKYLCEDGWTPEHTDAQYPRVSTSVSFNDGWDSDFWIKDGTYLRLKNMQLAYSLPDKLVRNSAIKGARIYLAGTNLFTLTEFKYIDPENPGINYGYYPQQRTFSLGVNLTF